MKRLVPDLPSPLYSSAPGRHPHPVSDPAGHSHGRPLPPPDALDPARWCQCRTYLHGIDLFNGPLPDSPEALGGYYWEAHEQWEQLWHACGRRGPTADFLKGLIKLAAAGVKHREGRPDGVRSHACRAAELFRAVADGEGMFLGLSLGALIALADRVCREGWPGEAPVLVPIELTAH